MTEATSMIDQQRSDTAAGRPPWHARPASEVLSGLDIDAERGLDGRAASERLRRYGPNRIVEEKPPSSWAVAAQQLRDPMNIMLLIVVAAGIVIGEFATAVIVGLLILLNVVLGARQELAARASVDALAKMQVPAARVVRDGAVMEVPAPELVPGDIVHLEAGDLVAADGRLLQSATLETQEAALTGESVPVAKNAGVVMMDGDRSAGLCRGASVVRRQEPRLRARHRQEPHRCRDTRRDERHQHRQDRHVDHERDDGLHALHRGRLVLGGRRGLPQVRCDHLGGRCAGARLHSVGPWAGARQRRHRHGRRDSGR
jgi:magnesium-transporting ATPase (P-type)